MRLVFLSAVLALLPIRVHGQLHDLAGPPIHLDVPGSWEADTARVSEFGGRSDAGFSLLRSPSSSLRLPAGPAVGLVPPSLRGAYNSDIPYSANDGDLWAGRGVSWSVSGGAYATAGPLRLVLAPTVSWSRNARFEFLFGEDPERSRMLAPWRIGETSADLPVRFGNDPFTFATLGQSSLWLDAGPASVGISTEDQWWGPGVRNAIVLSNNAPGIPHAFVRTRAPLRTRLGTVEAKWLLGGLTESLYFDLDPTNQYRSFNAAAVTLRPAFEPDLTLGLARSVYAPVSDRAEIAGHALDVATRWSAGAREDLGSPAEFEQMTALFGRWIFPEDGVEVYGEWARTRFPRSVRDFLVAPHHSQGYTLGLQWTGATRGDRRVRLQAEVTYLEKTPTYRLRYTPGFYMSLDIPQGYSNRGQVIGASIGPGASSQWIAGDLIGRRGSIGAFASRIRWDEDAFFSRPNGDRWFAHDVSLIVGLRGTRHLPWLRLDGEIASESRLNFLFQNPAYDFGDELAVDVHNLQLRLSVSPNVP